MRYLGISVILLLAACGNSGPAPRNADSGSPDIGTSIPTETPDSLGIDAVAADTLPVSQTGIDATQTVDGGMPDALVFFPETGIDSVSAPDSVNSADVTPAQQADVLPVVDTDRIPETGVDPQKQDAIVPADTTTSSDTGTQAGPEVGPEVQVSPCAINPCQNGGTCSVSGNTAVCACAGNRDPQTNCASCLTGFGGADCIPVDKCAGIVCNDNLYCNGTESCDPTTGKCVRKDIPSCGTHGSCDEFKDSCSCNDGFGGSSCDECAPGSIGVYPNCQKNPCVPNPCQNGGSCSVSASSVICTCTGHWNPATSCATCSGNWDIATSCTTCIAGFTGADCGTPLPCGGTNCSGHGICSSETNTCGCNLGYTGDSCNTCSPGYAGYPNCILTPRPKISGLGIDCSGGVIPGSCAAGGFSYQVTFSVSNATTCTASAVSKSGLGSSGSISSCVVSGSSGSFSYATGDLTFDIIRITVNATGPGGSATPASINVTLE